MKQSNKYTGLEVAVIGMAGKFPEAQDLNEFWENLKGGVNSIKVFTDEEVLAEGEDPRIVKDPSYVKANAYMEGKEHFDASFFGYRPDEAELMDPQMRKFHECCWEAIEDSGYGGAVGNKKVGVFAAGSPNPAWMVHALQKNKEKGLADEFTALHLRDITFLATKIAYNFNLKGPAVFVQSACSSSLIAVHEACNSLLLGECSMALAGGANIRNFSKKGYQYQDGMIHSKDGKCSPFDVNSSGTVSGEGVGVVVLKRLKDAIRDNDQIHAIIKGTAINNDGNAKVGFTAPGVTGQVEVVRKALKMASVEPGSIGYIEAHGTATQLGDNIEVEALKQVFGKSSDKTCALASVKSNIGHLDNAAGIAGMVKAILSIKNKQIPANLHFVKENHQINLGTSPLYVNAALKQWENPEAPLRAGVSSFGIGGTNAHIILEEAPVISQNGSTRPYHLLMLSAGSANSLQESTARLRHHLKGHKDLAIADISYTLQTGRESFGHRSICVCDSVEEAIALLSEKQVKETYLPTQQAELQNVVFMFPGQGSQYHQMAKDLYEHEIEFRKVVDECMGHLEEFSGENMWPVLFSNEKDPTDIDNTQYTQPLLFVVEYALARLLMTWGVKPGYMIGHSIGEYVAACLSGVFTLEDGLKLVFTRGQLMSQAEKGSMLSINIEPEAIKPYLEIQEEVDLAVVNGPDLCVVSGTHKAIMSLKARMEEDGHTVKRVNTSHAFHSHMMDGILEEFHKTVSQTPLNEPQIPYVSNLTGKMIRSEEACDPQYWCQHLRETVRFAHGTDYLLGAGNGVFIEVGPGRMLSNFLTKSSKYSPEKHKSITTVRHKKQEGNDQKYLIGKLGEMWLHGVEPDWKAYYGEEIRYKCSLPTYVFEKETFTTNFNHTKLLDQSGHQGEITHEHFLNHLTWKKSVRLTDLNKLNTKKHLVVFGNEDHLKEDLVKSLYYHGQNVIRVKKGDGFEKIDDLNYVVNTTNAEDMLLLWKDIDRSGISIQFIICLMVKGENKPVAYENISDKLTYSYLSLSILAQSLAKFPVKGEIRLFTITTDVAQVFSNEVVDPVKGTLMAPAKIIPSEITHLKSKVIDITYPKQGKDTRRIVDALLSEICHESDEYLIAYRNGDRWQPMYDKTNLENLPGSEAHITPGKTYLVVGGFGGMGFEIAKDISRSANVILTHRSEFPAQDEWDNWISDHPESDKTSQRITQLNAMKTYGNRLELFRLDVSQEDQVKEFAEQLSLNGLTPDGVIWAAGEIDHGGIIMNRKKEGFIKHLESKVHGLLLFEKYLDFEELDFLALFSSIGNVFYQIKFGQVAYNAANEFMDRYAQYANATWGIHAFAIDWCDWYDVGMSVKANIETYKTNDISEVNTHIKNGIYPEEGVVSFHQCLNHNLSQYVIYRDNLLRAIESHQDQFRKATTGLVEASTKPSKEAVPKADLENTLVRIFNDFFGTQVSMSDDFFELGGDSLKAMTLIGRINQKMHSNLSITDLYEYPTVKQLHGFLAKNGVFKQTGGLIARAEPKGHYALSSTQTGLYFLQQMSKESTAYNEPRILKIKGELDKNRLEKAFHGLIQRHEMLRTSFVLVDGKPRQLVSEQVDLHIQFEPVAGEEDIQKTIQSFITPFDLGKAPIFRVMVIEKSKKEHWILMDTHHIIVDGVSKQILLNDLLKLYNGETLGELGIQYKDYAEWQQSDDRRQIINEQEAFWLRELSEEILRLDLPYDFERSKGVYDQGEIVNLVFSKDEVTAMRNMIGKEEGMTMYPFLLAIFNILLHKITDCEDIVIGSPVSTRVHRDLEQVLGMFANTLVFRNFVHGDLRFKDFLHVVKSRLLGSLNHREFPFEKLVDLLDVERDTYRNPLFDVMLVYEKTGKDKLNLDGLEIIEENHSKVASRLDLTLAVVDDDESLSCHFVYASGLFQKSTIDRFASYFKNILTTIISNPDTKISDIGVMSKKEEHKLLKAFNDTSIPLPSGKTVVDLFMEHVTNTPDQTALIFEGKQVTYQALNSLANTVANRIADVLDERHPIGLYFEPSVEMVAALLGTLKFGSTYVPLSPDFPAERNEYILSDSGVRLVLMQESLSGNDDHLLSFIQKENIALIKVGDTEKETPNFEAYPTAPEDIIYIIYTSGTSGLPKGVAIRNEAVINYSLNRIASFGFNTNDVALQTLPYYFDGFGCNFYVTILSGGALALIPEEKRMDGQYLSEAIERYQVTNLATLPKLYGTILEETTEKAQLKTLRSVTLAGEKTTNSLIDKSLCIVPHVNISNEYGPTECTIGATINKVLKNEKATVIGKPIWNTSAYILGKNQELLPLGVKGELCVSGMGLAAAYMNNEVLTAEKFVDNPFAPGQKMYKTGDQAKWLSDGSIEILGRVDDQVKIRGYRIEPGEIEHQLMQYPGVSQAAVLPVGEMGAQYLAAYYVSEEGYADHQLREHLLSQLPEYMVPSHYLHMDQLPLTSNGKLDKRALPSPKSLQKDYQAPTTQEEQLIAEVFESVLGCEKVGITDDFFELGGDSIKSIQISSRLRDEGFGLTVQDIFRYRTISHMAKHLETLVEVSDQSEVEGTVSLTPIQHWFWSNKLRSKHHFNQSVMLRFKEKPSVGHLRLVFEKIQEHHDGLRLVFRENDGEVDQYNSSSSFPLHLEEHDLTSHTDAITAMGPLCDQIQSGIDLSTGPLMRLGLFHTPEGSLLLVAVHHLVIDGVSWRILFEDIDRLYAQVIQGEPLSLSSKTDSYQRWSEALVDYQNSVAYQDNRSFWESGLKKTIRLSSLRDYPSGGNTYADQQKASFTLTPAETSGLLKQAHVPFGTSIDELLLTSLVLSLHEAFGLSGASVVLENHGREDTGVKGMNTQRTIGWFTTMYPVLLEYTGEDLSLLIRTVKESLRQVPNKGMDYMLYRYSEGNKEGFEEASVSFNYLGQFDTDLDAESFEVLSGVYQGLEKGMDEEREYDWDISGIVVNGCLEMGLFYSGSQYSGSKIGSLMSSYGSNLKRLISYCLSYEGRLLSPSDFTYKQLSVDQVDLLANQYNIQDVYPLSSMQESMLLHSVLNPDSLGYYQQLTIAVEGDLDISLVEKSMLEIVQRHDILRTAFLNEGHERPLQVVLESRGIDFGYADISNDEASLQQTEIERYEQVFKSSMFDLSKDTLIKLQVLKTAGSRYLFVFGHHHILMDGWCMSVLLNDFKALYVGHREGVTPDLDTITPYSEYIKWLEGLDKSVASSYWSTYLEGYEGLSSVSERVPEKPFSLVSHDLLIDADRTAQLHALSAAYGVTINVIIQVAWGLLLSRYNHTDEVVFGAVVSGRPTSIKGIESMVGLFINTVPVRIGYGETDGIEALMRQVQDRSLGSEPHHYHPLSEIQALRADQTKDLFDHIITFENYPLADQIAMNESVSADSGLSFKNVHSIEQADYDLTLLVMPQEEILIRFDYNESAYSSSYISQLSGQLDYILRQLHEKKTAHLSGIRLLPEEKEHEYLTTFNQTAGEYPYETVLSSFKGQVNRSPGSVACICGDQTMTYSQLDTQSSQIASHLQNKQGIGKGSLVAIYQERSFELVATILGVLKSGAAYVGLDPSNPTDRVTSIIENSGVSLVLTSESTLEIDARIQQIEVDKILSEESILGDTDWGKEIRGEDLAYVLYTSGSTGKPKGVMITHQSLSNYIHWAADYYVGEEELRFGLYTSISFDLTVTSIFTPLVTGNAMVIYRGSGHDLIEEVLEDNQVELLKLTPSHLRLVRDSPLDLSASVLRKLIVGGEEFDSSLAKSITEKFSSQVSLYNEYGPTEATVGCMVHEYSVSDDWLPSVPLGVPIANMGIYVLDRYGHPVGAGCVGEVYISGVGLSTGYLGDEEKTSASFIVHEGLGLRLYRTGDLAKWDAGSGSLLFVGREDSQVKVRGYRIELGEIEGFVSGHGEVDHGVVLLSGEGVDVYLSCYYVSERGLTGDGLREYLLTKVPEYMVPQRYVRVEEVPLTAHGKVDKTALASMSEEGSQYQAPANETEEQLAAIWGEVLKRDKDTISTDVSFFELGGHSLTITILGNKILKHFNVKIPLQDFFDINTIVKMSEYINNEHWMRKDEQEAPPSSEEIILD